MPPSLEKGWDKNVLNSRIHSPIPHHLNSFHPGQVSFAFLLLALKTFPMPSVLL